VTASTFSGVRATKRTSKPPLATTSMIPVAMVPEPTTPTVSTVRAPSAAPPAVGVAASSTTSAEPASA
jgi:hypothetical protein